MEDDARSRAPKACRTCAKAKVRCEPEQNGICKRCRCLNKECVLQAPGAHRRQRPQNPEVTRLEQKLDNMAAILAASGPTRNRSSPPHGSWQSRLSPVFLDDNSLPSIQEAQLSVDFFRTRMVPLFPFVVIPAHITADKLRQEKPFLYLSIMMAADQNSTRQLLIGNRIKEYIAHHIIINGEQSLDLLQGLLVYLSWHHYHIQSTSQLTSLVHLMVAQLINLGLNRETTTHNSSKPTLSYWRELNIESRPAASRTLEERKAFLGCHYMISILSPCIRDLEPIRYTGYTDECCRVVEEACEYVTDVYLVHLVRLAQVADRVNRALSYDDPDPSSGLSAPLGLSIRWLRVDLLQLKSSVPSDIAQSSILLFHYSTLELLLYRIALNDEVPDARYGDYPLTRLEMLLSCLESTRSFFDMFLSLQARVYPILPYTIWSQLGHALVILSILSLLHSDRGDWDQDYVHSTIDFYDTVDMLNKKFEQALLSAEHEQQQGKAVELPEMFTRLPSRLRLMKEAHRRGQLAQSQHATPPAPTSNSHEFMASMNIDDILLLGPMSELFEGYI